MREFQQEYMAQWCQTDKEMALRSLARDYHERTEAFDQSHCRARDEDGFSRPQGAESAICLRFAFDQHEQLGKHAARLGFDSRAWQDAISSESRHFETDWVNGMYRDDPRFKGVSCVSH